MKYNQKRTVKRLILGKVSPIMTHISESIGCCNDTVDCDMSRKTNGYGLKSRETYTQPIPRSTLQCTVVAHFARGTASIKSNPKLGPLKAKATSEKVSPFDLRVLFPQSPKTLSPTQPLSLKTSFFYLKTLHSLPKIHLNMKRRIFKRLFEVGLIRSVFLSPSHTLPLYILVFSPNLLKLIQT